MMSAHPNLYTPEQLPFGADGRSGGLADVRPEGRRRLPPQHTARRNASQRFLAQKHVGFSTTIVQHDADVKGAPALRHGCRPLPTVRGMVQRTEACASTNGALVAVPSADEADASLAPKSDVSDDSDVLSVVIGHTLGDCLRRRGPRAVVGLVQVEPPRVPRVYGP